MNNFSNIMKIAVAVRFDLIVLNGIIQYFVRVVYFPNFMKYTYTFTSISLIRLEIICFYFDISFVPPKDKPPIMSIYFRKSCINSFINSLRFKRGFHYDAFCVHDSKLYCLIINTVQIIIQSCNFHIRVFLFRSANTRTVMLKERQLSYPLCQSWNSFFQEL